MRDGGIAIILGIIAIIGMGYGVARFTNVEDSPAEEALESVAEGLAEKSLGLPDGSLEGAIDVTPGSPEVITIDITPGSTESHT